MKYTCTFTYIHVCRLIFFENNARMSISDFRFWAFKFLVMLGLIVAGFFIPSGTFENGELFTTLSCFFLNDSFPL